MITVESVKSEIENLLLNISKIVNMEFSIFQKDGRLIISTNRYRQKKGQAVHTRSIKEAFHNEVLAFDQPGDMDLCHGCRFQHHCPAKYELLRTIRLHNETVGVIALTFFKKDDHLNAVLQQEDFMAILNNVTNVVISILKQEEQKQRNNSLMQIIYSALNNFKEPFIICNPHGIILYQNEPFRNLMKQSERLPLTVNEFLPDDSTKKILKGVTDFNLMMEGEPFTISSSSIMNHHEIHGVILHFYQDRSYKKDTSNLPLEQISGKSTAIEEIKDKIVKIKNSSSTVLLTGETGTGKSTFAKAIHKTSVRTNRPFVSINCASLPEALFESELFGYEDGAFTGAKRGGKKGYFEQANGGTLLLDEIGEVPYHLQAKLLKVLEESYIYRVGGTQPIQINVRIIASTNQKLEQLIEEGNFREDLYYRLSVIPIEIPPLKNRIDDIELLAFTLLKKHSDKAGKQINDISEEVLAILKTYHWPGNVRELENAIEYAANMESSTTFSKDSLPERILSNCTMGRNNVLNNSFHNTQRDVIQQTLGKYGYDYNGKKRAAEELGISIRTLYRRIEKLEIPEPEKSS